MSDTRSPRAIAGGETHPIPVIVVIVTLLERALDLVLGVCRHHVETVDQLKIVISSLPPVVKDIRSDAAPVAGVSDARSKVTRSQKSHLPVTPLQAREVAGVDNDTLADLAFLNLDFFFLAVGSLAAGLLGGRDF